MKELQELVSVITRNKTKSITIIGNGSNDNSKLNRFYHLIYTGQVTSDDEAFQRLYPNEKSKNSFYKLKHQLKERLYSTTIFINAKKTKFSSRREAFTECQFLLALANNLNALGARRNMLVVCDKVLKIAERYDFTSERINAAKKKMNNLVTLGRIKEANQAATLIESLCELQRKETYAELYWAQIQAMYVLDRSLKPEIFDIIESRLNKLAEIECSETSIMLEFHLAILETAKFMTVNEYASAAEAAARGLELMIARDYLYPTVIYSLTINLIACRIGLRQFHEGEQALASLGQFLTPGKFNWFKANEIHFILLLHTKQYEKAKTLHQETTGRKDYKDQPAYIQEIWIIYGAYLRILANAGKIPLTTKQKASPFRIRRYLNNLPTFSKDKRGQNIPVLVSHILLQLQQGKLEKVDDRLEAIGKYRSRYAGVEKNFRGNVFLHMLNELARANFDRIITEKKTKKLRALLDTVPVDVTSQGYDQEVLPYEDTWDLILSALPKAVPFRSAA
jgi:hypothetical protein